MEAVLAWAITHPLITILGMVAAPIVATSIAALRGTRVVDTTPAAAAPEAPPAVEPVPLRAPAVADAPVSEPEPALEPELLAEAAVEARAEPAELSTEQSTELAAEPVVEKGPEPATARVPLRERLTRTSDSLVGRLGSLLGSGKVDADLLAELEALLFTADLGVRTAESLLETVRSKASGSDASAVTGVLREAILSRLTAVQAKPLESAAEGPFVILVLGVNGSGKTTTIGKLAARYSAEGKKVVLGAGDTFRAAAAEQLKIWGERVGCEVIAGQAGGDPTSVAFDTVKAARARGADVAIIDTAGRLQTKKPLMEELAKMSRVLTREIPDAPHQTLLVLDANTGQNAISQARLFSEVTAVTDLALTKLDGTAKGGVIVGLADEFGIPVRYVGIGEAIEDLRDFDAAEFVDALFSDPR
jgi:fused signal recognition particle receptor